MSENVACSLLAYSRPWLDGKCLAWNVLQLPTVQRFVNFALLDHFHGLLRIFDLHGGVLVVSNVSGYTYAVTGSLPRNGAYRHSLLGRPSGGVVFRRSTLSRLSRFTNSKIGRNFCKQEGKVSLGEQDFRLRALENK